jgi:putative two-component system response regulator
MIWMRRVDVPPTTLPHTHQGYHSMHAHLLLVVDDDTNVRTVIRRTLGQSYDLIEADNGCAAVALALRHHPNLILLDLGLPDMDGYTVARLVHNDPVLKKTPILAVTGESTATVQSLAQSAGKAELLQKPFNLSVLEQTVATLLGTAYVGTLN